MRNSLFIIRDSSFKLLKILSNILEYWSEQRFYRNYLIAFATALATRLSNGDGMMQSAVGLAISAAKFRAAVSFIWGVIFLT